MPTNFNPVLLDPEHAAVLSDVAEQTGKSCEQLVADAIDIAFLKMQQPTREHLSPEQQRQNLQALLEETSKLPICHPQDGLSGRDHDEILYGKNAS